MKIYGDPKISNKFFVYLDDESVIWTKNFETAKSYIQNVNYKDWFGKTLYCTNEDIVKGYNGKLYLRSKLPINPDEIKVFDNKTLFVENGIKFIKDMLNDLSKNEGFESFSEAISWKNSKIEKFKLFAKDIFDYRDKLYNHFYKCYDKNKEQIENTSELLDLSAIYKDFLDNIPTFK